MTTLPPRIVAILDQAHASADAGLDEMVRATSKQLDGGVDSSALFGAARETIRIVAEQKGTTGPFLNMLAAAVVRLAAQQDGAAR